MKLRRISELKNKSSTLTYCDNKDYTELNSRHSLECDCDTTKTALSQFCHSNKTEILEPPNYDTPIVKNPKTKTSNFSFIYSYDNSEEQIYIKIKQAHRQGQYFEVVTYPSKFKNTTELVKAEGLEAYRQAFIKAKNGAIWMAEYIVNKHSHSGIFNREDCLNELLLYQHGISSIEDKDTFNFTWKSLIERNTK